MEYLRGQLEDFQQLQEGINVKQAVYFSWSLLQYEIRVVFKPLNNNITSKLKVEIFILLFFGTQNAKTRSAIVFF